MELKRLLALVIALILSLALFVGCADTSQQSQEQGETQTEEPAETEDEPTVDYKVGLIAGLTGLGDKSMNDQALLGCQNAERDFGISYEVFEPKDTTQVLDMMQSLIDQDYDMIVAAVPDYDTIIEELAPNAPDVSFVTIDSTLEAENIMSVEYLTHEGSFLAGAAAAMKSETGMLGCVGGMDFPAIRRFIVGFEEGAQYVNSEAEVISKYIGTTYEAWADTTTAKSITLDMQSSGVDVVFQIAGGAGLGVINGCEETGIWAIGVNVDQEEVAPDTVLTSMLTKGEVAVYGAIEQALSGEPVSGRYIASLENGSVGIVYSRHLSQDEIDELKEIEAAIISGEIVVTDYIAE